MRNNIQSWGIFFVSLILITGCGSTEEELNRKLAIDWIALLNKHDTVAIAALYADSARIESPNWEAAKIGPAEIKTVYARYFLGTPDLSHQVTHLITTDSSIVVEYKSAGTFLQPENGTPAYMKGKRYELENCSRMTVRDGKIVDQKNYFDQVAFLRQVGFFDPH